MAVSECDHKAGSDYGEKSDTNRGAIRGGPFREVCGKCGARRVDAQLGLERTPAEYVAHMVEVGRLLRRVLRDDGTLWVNLGSSFCSQIEDDQEYELRPGLGEAEVAEVLAGLSAMRENEA